MNKQKTAPCTSDRNSSTTRTKSRPGRLPVEQGVEQGEDQQCPKAQLLVREKAQKELGAKFDIRKFHDEVLAGGALPMGVLEERIDSWIARER